MRSHSRFILSITASNYEEAIAFLKDTFGNKQMIINKHLKGLLNKAPVTSKNDLKGLMLVMLVMPPTHPWNFRNLLT